jgi:hypothetical protein
MDKTLPAARTGGDRRKRRYSVGCALAGGVLYGLTWPRGWWWDLFVVVLAGGTAGVHAGDWIASRFPGLRRSDGPVILGQWIGMELMVAAWSWLPATGAEAVVRVGRVGLGLYTGWMAVEVLTSERIHRPPPGSGARQG